MKHSIAPRGSIVWNALSAHYDDDDNVQSVNTYCKMAKKFDTLHRMDFNALSVQSIPNSRRILYFINNISTFIDYIN